MCSAQEAEALMQGAEELYSQAEVEAALDRMAIEINDRLGDADPLLLSVMVGGLVTTGCLLPRLDFQLQLDYLHASRYGSGNNGGELQWHAHSRKDLAGRKLLVVDDILDEGITLAAIIEACLQQGAAAIYSAVLLEKERTRELDIKADFVGLTVPDRFVFGYGLDCHGYGRNAAGIYALPE